MKRYARRIAFLILVLTATGTAAVWSAGRAGADGSPVQLTVKITDDGFSPKTVQVQQGQQVELTFQWAQTTNLDDQHVIAIDGYDVQTDTIDSDHTSSTITFSASKAGTFAFKCAIECAIHPALQGGALIVGSGAGSAAAVSPPKPSIYTNASLISVQGDSVVIGAQLLSPTGVPMTKAVLHFLVQETFVNTTGLAEIGQATTGQDGIAQLVYRPSQTQGQQLVIRYAGSAQYDPAEVHAQIPPSRLFAPQPAAPTVSLHGLRSWAPAMLLVVIVGIWATFVVLLVEVGGLGRLSS